MADPRWRIQDGGQPYVFLGNYDVISTFKVSKHMSKCVFYMHKCCILYQRDDFTNIIDILRI